MIQVEPKCAERAIFLLRQLYSIFPENYRESLSGLIEQLEEFQCEESLLILIFQFLQEENQKNSEQKREEFFQIEEKNEEKEQEKEQINTYRYEVTDMIAAILPAQDYKYYIHKGR